LALIQLFNIILEDRKKTKSKKNKRIKQDRLSDFFLRDSLSVIEERCIYEMNSNASYDDLRKKFYDDVLDVATVNDLYPVQDTKGKIYVDVETKELTSIVKIKEEVEMNEV